ncbi:hypothetical protein [Streptomyces laurentii]|uniref:hypothetical protein n=1 Tax=Streptomyces laurentii TaxID=39478 RepID=UPI0036AAA9FA
MTPTPARRPLGAGPAEQPIRAAEADLHALPSVDFPDPTDLRARGVLAPPSAPAPRARRVLGNGGRPDTEDQEHDTGALAE